MYSIEGFETLDWAAMEPDILILRDPRESARKCSLTPLRGRPGVQFIDFGHGRRVDASGRLLLDPDGDELDERDAELGVFLIDCAWRRLPKIASVVDGDPPRRRLPELVTAYPRKSRNFPDPTQGLASVEALYAALAILGRPRPGSARGLPLGRRVPRRESIPC